MFETAVVGGGVMGLSTAYALLQRGVSRVVVLEKHAVGHERAASTDTSKAIRYEYGESEMYALMVGQAIELWRALERETWAGLYVNCGVVTWGRGDAPHARASYRTLSRLGLPVREVSPEQLCREYPQFAGSDISYATINPDGGFLRASDCVAALARRVRQLGGEIREGAGVEALHSEARGLKLLLQNGERIEAERVVLALGAWASTLPAGLGASLPVTANKQQVVYLEGLGEQFAPGNFPVYLNLDHDFYGFPLDQNGLLKASIHLPGPLVDPNVPEMPDPDFTEQVVSLMRRYMPGTAAGRVRLSRVCMYAMTPDEDFILDHLPAHSNVVIGAGFSGHGFKFGILIGELLAALSLGEEPLFSLAPFSLSRRLS